MQVMSHIVINLLIHILNVLNDDRSVACLTVPDHLEMHYVWCFQVKQR